MTPSTSAPLIGGAAAVLLAGVGRYEGAAAAIVVGVRVAVIPVDLRHRRIPTRPVVVGGAALVATVAMAVVRGDAERAAVAALGAVVVGGAFLAVHLVNPAGMGF